MNLYDLHTKPETLKGYEQRFQVPELAYREAARIFNKTKKRVPELEHTFAKVSRFADEYAYLIRERFLEGEPAIAKDPERAAGYAISILKKRWPEAEAAITTNPQGAYQYATHILKRPWPEGEVAIAKSPRWSYHYASQLLEHRFLEGEPAIAGDPWYAWLYNQKFGTKFCQGL